MSLESGRYTILSEANSLFIGRLQHEEKSLNPKSIVTLPADVPATEDVEKFPNDVYLLAARGARVTEIYGKVVAELVENDEPTGWSIKLREDYGPNVYTVEAPSGNGWVILEDGPGTQVVVGPLSSNGLFTFERVDSD